MIVTLQYDVHSVFRKKTFQLLCKRARNTVPGIIRAPLTDGIHRVMHGDNLPFFGCVLKFVFKPRILSVCKPASVQLVSVEHNKLHVSVTEWIVKTEFGIFLNRNFIIETIKRFVASVFIGRLMVARYSHYGDFGQILNVCVEHVVPIILIFRILDHIAGMHHEFNVTIRRYAFKNVWKRRSRACSAVRLIAFRLRIADVNEFPRSFFGGINGLNQNRFGKTTHIVVACRINVFRIRFQCNFRFAGIIFYCGFNSAFNLVRVRSVKVCPNKFLFSARLFFDFKNGAGRLRQRVPGKSVNAIRRVV